MVWFERRQPSWLLSSASVRGKLHRELDLPNQDSCWYRVSEQGDNWCAAVCDGAGTAARSQEGAELTARTVADHLFGEVCRDASGVNSEHVVRAWAIEAVNLAREQLQARGDRLQSFHCTLVAWLCTTGGAWVVQVGDSMAISTRFAVATSAEPGAPDSVDFFPDDACCLHEPERGEYANETHFVTEPDWQAHLRLHRLAPDTDALVLMSDGVMDLAVHKGRVFRGFLSSLVGKLLAQADVASRDQTVTDWLDHPKAHRLSSDDRTLFIAVRMAHRDLAGRPVVLQAQADRPDAGQETAPPAATTATT